MPDSPSPRTRPSGRQSRQTILETARSVATVDGLEGLTIGRLADQVGMSKSGLYAHFRSKEELQLATIAAAEEVFRQEVLDPAGVHPEGVQRLLGLVDAYLSYLERRVFPGGCFFAATGNEFAGRTGPVADRIRELNEASLRYAIDQVVAAQRNGELDPAVDAEQLAFEIDSLMLGAHASFILYSDAAFLERARHAVQTRLR